MAEQPPTEPAPEREPPADDERPIIRRDVVDDQSAASFPASDPPGWWAGR